MNIYNLDSNKVKVIHNGASTLSNSMTNVKNYIKEDYILYVGRINKMKNIYRLLIAYSKILNKINHDLVIISDDKEALDMEIEKAKLDDRVIDRIKLLQNIREEMKYQVMSKAKLLVSPTLYEGFGLAPVEAMACGCPVIVSDNSCIPEICGNAAMFVDPYNTDSIADSIVKLIEDNELRLEIIERGLNRVKEFN